MSVISAWEERSCGEELGEDAPDGPYIDGLRTTISSLVGFSFWAGHYLGIHLERKHDFRCTVPPRSHVLRHQPSRLLPIRRNGVLHAPREPEIAYFEIAVGVQEEIGGFEISVDDVCAVYGFESA